MRNYVIINGVNSTTIQGLAINILPPITKPLMRNQIEEIDGRDGDLITELGYSAYDKTMEIGLWGTYDLNAIIKFFTGNGTIVFSTEPDKYYFFRILNQIDYEKLLKFKQATITFHCQPFKYPVSESTLSLTTGDNTVNNIGNVYAKPILTIVGSGTVGVSLDGEQIFSIDMSNNSRITIDTEKLEAYNPTDGSLLNRIVTGDYSLFKINSGNNTVKLEGTITSATLNGYTRWL